MVKFANFEFIFAGKGPKLALRDARDKLIKHKIGNLLFITCTLSMTWGDEQGG